MNSSDPFGLCVLWIRWCPPRDAHYARNQHNLGIPQTFTEMQQQILSEGSGWERVSAGKSIYHRHGAGHENNLKFKHTDGLEAVYDTVSNRLVTDPRNLGTFNFGHDPRLHEVDHFFLDIIPYWLWGNSASDPTPIDQRIFGPPTNRWSQSVSTFLDRMQAAGVPITVRQ